MAALMTITKTQCTKNTGNVMITAAAQKQQEGTIGTRRGGAKTRYDDDI
jgi:hypothetical protein